MRGFAPRLATSIGHDYVHGYEHMFNNYFFDTCWNPMVMMSPSTNSTDPVFPHPSLNSIVPPLVDLEAGAVNDASTTSQIHNRSVDEHERRVSTVNNALNDGCNIDHCTVWIVLVCSWQQRGSGMAR